MWRAPAPVRGARRAGGSRGWTGFLGVGAWVYGCGDWGVAASVCAGGGVDEARTACAVCPDRLRPGLPTTTVELLPPDVAAALKAAWEAQWSCPQHAHEAAELLDG